MKQSQADPNLRPAGLSGTSWNFIPVQQTAARIEGLPWSQNEHHWNRLPDRLMNDSKTSPTLRHVAAQQSGGRIRFRTRAATWALRGMLTRTETGILNTHGSLSGLDVYLRTPDAGFKFVKSAAPSMNETVFVAECKRPAALEGGVEWIVYFPLQNPLGSLELAVPDDAPILSPPPPRIEHPALFYGSSITQGFSASRPGLSYPAIISRRLDIPFINLGYGGNAKGEPEVAAAIAALDLSLFVCDLDHNLPGVPELEARHAAFVDIVRKAHPQIPILVVSSPNYWNDPDYFGKRTAIIRRTVEQACAGGDSLIEFIDGRTFWDPVVAGDMTVDNLHPNDAGFARMAEIIGDRVAKALAGR